MLCVFVATETKYRFRCANCGSLVRSKTNSIRRICKPRGPGWHLKRLIKRLGFSADSGCKCSDHAKRMDEWGCDKCEENIETIGGWLKAEAAKRGIPYFSAIGRMFVRRAISNARKEAERAKATT